MKPKQAHTPGPWEIKTAFTGHLVLVDRFGRRIVTVEKNHAESHQHAALIAQAPELLKSVKSLRELLTSLGYADHDRVYEADGVIDRAEGGI